MKDESWEFVEYIFLCVLRSHTQKSRIFNSGADVEDLKLLIG